DDLGRHAERPGRPLAGHLVGPVDPEQGTLLADPGHERAAPAVVADQEVPVRDPARQGLDGQRAPPVVERPEPPLVVPLGMEPGAPTALKQAGPLRRRIPPARLPTVRRAPGARRIIARPEPAMLG